MGMNLSEVIVIKRSLVTIQVTAQSKKPAVISDKDLMESTGWPRASLCRSARETLNMYNTDAHTHKKTHKIGHNMSYVYGMY